MLHYRKIHTIYESTAAAAAAPTTTTSTSAVARIARTTTTTGKAAAAATADVGFKRYPTETGCSVGNDNAEDKEVAGAASDNDDNDNREGFCGLRECFKKQCLSSE